jgi:TRAP-type C4-dicarboxylate transport system permease small subunit
VPKRSQESWLNAMMFERRHEKLAPVSVFVKRLIGSLAIALGLIAFALMIGIAGYYFLAGFNLVNSLLEASMILGGMGPVNQLPNDTAKIFASAYALFSGLIFIAVMGLVLSPVVHRILHKFHVDEKNVDK